MVIIPKLRISEINYFWYFRSQNFKFIIKNLKPFIYQNYHINTLLYKIVTNVIYMYKVYFIVPYKKFKISQFGLILIFRNLLF